MCPVSHWEDKKIGILDKIIKAFASRAAPAPAPTHPTQTKPPLPPVVVEKGRWNRVNSTNGENCFYLRIKKMPEHDIRDVTNALGAFGVPFNEKTTHAFGPLPEKVLFITLRDALGYNIFNELDRVSNIGSLCNSGKWHEANSPKDGKCFYYLPPEQGKSGFLKDVGVKLEELGIPYIKKETMGFGPPSRTVLSVKYADARRNPAVYAALSAHIQENAAGSVKPPAPTSP